MRTRKRLSALIATAGLVLALGVPVSAANAHSTPDAASSTVGALGGCNYSGSHPELRPSNSYSAAVKHAQCLHNIQAPARYDITVDGYFGQLTTIAIKRIQTKCAIDSDGIIGPDTWKCLHPDQVPNPYWPA